MSADLAAMFLDQCATCRGSCSSCGRSQNRLKLQFEPRRGGRERRRCQVASEECGRDLIDARQCIAPPGSGHQHRRRWKRGRSTRSDASANDEDVSRRPPGGGASAGRRVAWLPRSALVDRALRPTCSVLLRRGILNASCSCNAVSGRARRWSAHARDDQRLHGCDCSAWRTSCSVSGCIAEGQREIGRVCNSVKLAYLDRPA